MVQAISFIVPAYNDAATIRQVIGDIDKVARTNTTSYDIFIANDASPDSLASVLDAVHHKNVRVITHTKNQGYGKTIRELYKAADKSWIMSLPGDRQVRADALRRLMPYTKTHDMIIGKRINRWDPPKRILQSRVYNSLLSLLFGTRVSDANSVRLMKKEIIDATRPGSTSAFYDAELAIRAKDKGYKIIEVPIKHYARIGGAGGGGKLGTIIPTIIDMVKFFLWYHMG